MEEYDIYRDYLLKMIDDDATAGMSGKELINKYTDDSFYDKVAMEMVESTHELQLKSYIDNMANLFVKTQEEEKNFNSEFNKRWDEGLILLKSLRNVCVDLLMQFEGESHDNYMKKCLKEILIRGCQVYQEIFVLLANGLVEGAWARWRTFFELGIVSQFIKENGECAARGYINSKNERKEHYNWAKVCSSFNDYQFSNVTFKSIFERCRTKKNKWYDKYSLASVTIHAGARGTFYRFSGCNKKSSGIGGELEGISLPAIYSAQSLTIIAMNYLLEFDGFYSSVSVKTISKWTEEIRKCFEAIEKKYQNKL